MARVGEHHRMGWVMQKGRPAFHRLQDAACTLDAQRVWRDAFPFSHPEHQRFGLMNVQVVQDHVPLRGFGIAGHQALHMRESILFGARRSPGWFDDVAGDDIEIDKPGEGAMPDILELTPQHVAWVHRQVGMLALQGLHPSQFIHTDAALSLLGPLRGQGIHLTPLHNFLAALRIGYLRQPVAEAVRSQAPFLSSRAACRGEICSTIPRTFTSSALSRPVHWLIGRPDLAGASHAKAAM